MDLDLVCEGTVSLDCVELECGVDWELPDASTLRLLGAACESLQDGAQHSVDAAWPCEVIVIAD